MLKISLNAKTKSPRNYSNPFPVLRKKTQKSKASGLQMLVVSRIQTGLYVIIKYGCLWDYGWGSVNATKQMLRRTCEVDKGGMAVNSSTGPTGWMSRLASEQADRAAVIALRCLSVVRCTVWYLLLHVVSCSFNWSLCECVGVFAHYTVHYRTVYCYKYLVFLHMWPVLYSLAGLTTLLIIGKV